MTTRVLIAAVVLAVLLAAYLGESQRPQSENATADLPPVEQHAGNALATAEPVEAIQPKDDGDDATERSLEERSSAIKRRISDAVASRYREEYIQTLVGEGLSRSDSANIVQTFLDALAECHFDSTRRRYETYGLTREQFVRGAEEVWNPRDYHGVSVDAIARNAPECVAQAGQQAGIPIAAELNGGPTASAPEDFGILARPNLIAEQAGAAERDGTSPAWAQQMEAKIRAHVDRHSGASLTDLRIKCEERGCVVLLQGQQIPIFEFEFDRFAVENGFASALLGGDAARRIVWLLK